MFGNYTENIWYMKEQEWETHGPVNNDYTTVEANI